MAADLHIHVAEGITQEDLKCFFSNSLGSKYFNFHYRCPEQKGNFRTCACSHWDKIMHSPSVWVGEVSWLKAALFDDAGTFVPDLVANVSRIIGEDLPVIDDALIASVQAAFALPNNTIKVDGVWDGQGYSLGQMAKVITFLEKHKGKRVFTVSW